MRQAVEQPLPLAQAVFEIWETLAHLHRSNLHVHTVEMIRANRAKVKPCPRLLGNRPLQHTGLGVGLTESAI